MTVLLRRLTPAEAIARARAQWTAAAAVHNAAVTAIEPWRSVREQVAEEFRAARRVRTSAPWGG